MGTIRTLWSTRPLLVILVVAALLRLLAALYSQGYAMSDDHFQVIEVALVHPIRFSQPVRFDQQPGLVRVVLLPGPVGAAY